MIDIAVIGGGPSGMAAAIQAKKTNPLLRVCVLEKMETVGKKLSVTGNGRCNISNVGGEDLNLVLSFFSQTGVAVRREEDKLYPYSESAKELTWRLQSFALSIGVEIMLNTEVKRVEAVQEGGFLLFVEGNGGPAAYATRKLLISTGGKSYGNTGSTGDGFNFARKLGHSVNKLIPGLTAIETMQNISHLKGLRSKGRASLYEYGKLIFEESGEIQFREDSISGICVMNMSGLIRMDQNRTFEAYLICLNFVPDFTASDLISFLSQKAKEKGLKASCLLQTLVKNNLALEILKRSGVSADRMAMDISNGELIEVANNLRMFQLQVKGLKGWNEAQITIGGVKLDEIDLNTMESKIVKNLYFSGEVLDYAGPCGGFNLHHSWLTGIKAGTAMAGEKNNSGCNE